MCIRDRTKSAQYDTEMAIAGITTAHSARPVQRNEIETMLADLGARREQESVLHFDDHCGVAATSPFSTVSLYVGEDVVVGVDCDLLNYDELRERVGTEAAPAAELIARLYRQYGTKFLRDLRGGFSLGIWDRSECRLVLAVDHMGIKPLAYAVADGAIVFAGRARGIIASGRVAARVNPNAIVDYLNFSAVPIPNSAFVGITKVAPGTFIIWERGQVKTSKYWDIEYSEDMKGGAAELAKETLARMEEAVRIAGGTLRPEQTGCFLSGGTDSSSVLGLLTRITQRPVKSFSIGFREERFNELHYAHVAAKQFGSNHHDRIIGPAETFDAIQRIAAAYDEPYGNSSVIPTYYCLKAAQEAGVATMLAGDGGDELFGGNERYRTDKIFQVYSQIPTFLRRGLLDPMSEALPDVSFFGKLKRYVRTANTPNPERYCAWLLLRRFAAPTIIGPAVLNGGSYDVLSAMRIHYASAPAHSELNRLLYVDVKMTLGDNDIPKVMGAAQIARVNVRFPLMDYRLAEFSARLPARLKVRGMKKRYLFKRATRNLLPQEILNKTKHGFGLPIGLWLKTDPQLRSFSREVLLDSRTYQRGYFRREFVEYLIRNMESDDTPYYGDLLWLFLMLELWHREHVEGLRIAKLS